MALRIDNGSANAHVCGWLRTAIASVVLALLASPEVAAEQPTLKGLQQQLQRRDRKIEEDRIIQDLARRLELLERQATAASAPAAPSPVKPRVATATPQLKPRVATATPQLKPRVATATPQPTAPTQANGGARRTQLKVDEEEAERALDRTLVVQGALLVPFKQAEIQPTFDYTREETNNSSAATVNGSMTGAGEEERTGKSLLEMRQKNVVVQKWDLSCGAAALATLLNYQHGDRVTEREVAKGLIGRPEYLDDPDRVRRQEGFSLLDLKRVVSERGYEGVTYGGMQYEKLIERAPLLVPINTLGYNHFVIFRGVMGDRVLLADPAYGNRTMSIEKFQRLWIDYPGIGHVGFMVQTHEGPAPPGQLAPNEREFLTLR